MLVWGLFIGLIIIFLALDLGVFHKHEHVIKTKEAGIWTAIWVTVALSFSGVIYWLFSNDIIENPTALTPNDAVLKYITGYLIELSLSVDNVFVIAVIFFLRWTVSLPSWPLRPIPLLYSVPIFWPYWD